MPGSGAVRSIWPAVPGIMPGEAFGSWFGRIAAGYGLDVLALARAADLGLDLGAHARAWIAAHPPMGSGARMLSALTGIAAEEIERMGADAGPGRATHAYAYCFRCLVLNPWDVAAPYWQRRWLQGGWSGCDEHPAEYDELRPSHLQTHRNMSRLLKLAGQRHAARVRRRRSNCDEMRVVSTVRGHH